MIQKPGKASHSYFFKGCLKDRYFNSIFSIFPMMRPFLAARGCTAGLIIRCSIIFVFFASSVSLHGAEAPFQLSIQQKHSGWVTPLAFSPDGNLIVTQSVGVGNPKIWNVRTGVILKTLPLGRVYSVMFTPDSGRIVISDYSTARNSYVLLVYNLTSNRFEKEIFDYYAIGTASNSEVIAVNKPAGSLQLLNITTGNPVKTLLPRYNNQPVSGDGALIADCDGSAMQCAVYETRTMKKIRSFSTGRYRIATAYKFSTDNSLLVGYSNYTFGIFEIRSGNFLEIDSKNRMEFDKKTRKLVSKDDHGKIRSLGFDAARRRMMVCYEDRTIQWVDLSKKSLGNAFVLPGKKEDAPNVLISPDGRTIAAGSLSTEVHLYESGTLQLLRALDGVYSGSATMGVSFRPDGKHLASVSDRGRIKIYDLENLRIVKTIGTNEKSLTNALYSPDGKILAVSTDNRHVIFLDGRTYAFRIAYAPHSPKQWKEPYVTRMAFSRDGRFLISASREGDISVIDTKTNQFAHRITIGASASPTQIQYAQGLAVSPDGEHFAAGLSNGRDGNIHVYSLSDGKLKFRLPGHRSGTGALAYSPDGKRLVSGSWDRELKVWDMAGRREMGTLRHDELVSGVAWTPDGRYILSAGGTVAGVNPMAVFDAKTYQLLRHISGHSLGVSGLAVSPDGRFFATGSYDTTEKIYRTDNFESLTLLAADEKNWMFYDDQGYFDASTNAGSFLCMVKGRETYSMEQFALKLNRPDILLARLGLAGPEAMNYFKNLYLKRLGKAGFTEGDMSPDLRASGSPHNVGPVVRQNHEAQFPARGQPL